MVIILHGKRMGVAVHKVPGRNDLSRRVEVGLLKVEAIVDGGDDDTAIAAGDVPRIRRPARSLGGELGSPGRVEGPGPPRARRARDGGANAPAVTTIRDGAMSRP